MVEPALHRLRLAGQQRAKPRHIIASAGHAGHDIVDERRDLRLGQRVIRHDIRAGHAGNGQQQGGDNAGSVLARGAMEQHRAILRLGNGGQHSGDLGLLVLGGLAIEIEQNIILRTIQLQRNLRDIQPVEQRDIDVAHPFIVLERIGRGRQFMVPPQIDHRAHTKRMQVIALLLRQLVQPIGPQHPAMLRLPWYRLPGLRCITAEITQIVSAGKRNMACGHQRSPDFMKD